MTERVVIQWFRRDLRLEDNKALQAALDSGGRVVPLFILDPVLLSGFRVGAARVTFMLSALCALDDALQRNGGSLLIRRGVPDRVLPEVAREFAAQAVYANADYSPYARGRDAQTAAALPVPLHVYEDAVLRPPGTVVKADGFPFVVYTPFKRRWRALPEPAQPERTRIAAGALWSGPSDAVPSAADLGFSAIIDVPDAREGNALRRLERFAAGPIYEYHEARNRLVSDPFAENPPVGSSYLSPYVHFGLLSPRQVYAAARAAGDAAPTESGRASVMTWIDELIWREFYVHILYHFPRVVRENFRIEYDRVAWRDAPDDLAAWQAGRTGYPVIDAAMRQLNQIGWMPNRARMVVASFLTKDLLIHWREGERYFMRQLIDGDLAANNGGWQWAAGTGTDAQPYFRIFNPVSQSRQYDADGAYIRRWVPELSGVPAAFIHAPWEMEHPPRNYPPPIIPHAVARARALAAFKAAKG